MDGLQTNNSTNNQQLQLAESLAQNKILVRKNAELIRNAKVNQQTTDSLHTEKVRLLSKTLKLQQENKKLTDKLRSVNEKLNEVEQHSRNVAQNNDTLLVKFKTSEETLIEYQVQVKKLEVKLSSSKSQHADVGELHDKLSRVDADIRKLATDQQTALVKVNLVNTENRDLRQNNETLENEIKKLTSQRRKLEDALKGEKISKPEVEIRELKSKLREKRTQLQDLDKSLIKQNNRNNALCFERDRLKQDLNREIECVSITNALNNDLKLQVETLQKQLAVSEASQKTLNSTTALRTLLTDAEKKEQRTEAAMKMLRLQVHSTTKERDDLKHQLNVKLDQVETLTCVVDMKGVSESVRYERFLESNRELECEIGNLKRQLKENANVVFTQKEEIALLQTMVDTHNNNFANQEAKIKKLGPKASESDAQVNKLESEAKEKDEKFNELMAKLQAANEEIKTLNIKTAVLEDRLKKPDDLCEVANVKQLEKEVQEKHQKFRMLENELEETVVCSLESQKDILQLKLYVDSLKNSLKRKTTNVMELEEQTRRKDEMMKTLKDKAAEKDEKAKKWKQTAAQRGAKLKRIKKSALRKVEAERNKASKIGKKLVDEARETDKLLGELKDSINSHVKRIQHLESQLVSHELDNSNLQWHIDQLRHRVLPRVAPEESEIINQNEGKITAANKRIYKLEDKAKEKDEELEELKKGVKRQTDNVVQLLKKLDSLELNISGLTWELDQERKQREQDQAQLHSQVETLRKKEVELTHATQNIKTLGEVVERFKADNIQNICFVDGILKEKADLEAQLRAFQGPTSFELKCELYKSLQTCEKKLEAATATSESLKSRIFCLERSVEEKEKVIREKDEQLSENEMRLTYLSMELTALSSKSDDNCTDKKTRKRSQIENRSSCEVFFNEETQHKKPRN